MNVPAIKITDKHGVPMKRAPSAQAFRGAGGNHPSLTNWWPGRYSGHSALSGSREILSDRIHDLVRNDGWASAATSRYLDNLVGSGWRLSAKPNTVTLGITREQADEVADQIEALWYDYTNDLGFWCDAERATNMNGLLGLATRHQFVDGEAIGWVGYRENAPGGFGTCTQVIDPMRLSNPNGRMDTETIRDGVEVDEWGAATKYHIRQAHPGELAWGGANNYIWEEFDRETEWGRPVIIHMREKKWAGMTRGEAILAPVAKKIRQITDCDDIEMQAMQLNATLAAYISTPVDPEILAGGDELSNYARSEIEYYGKNPLEMGGVQLGVLHPGSEIRTVKTEHPSANFEAFERNALRNIASAAGITYEAMTADYSQANYSSIRASLVEFRRGFAARTMMIGSTWQSQIYRCFLEEIFDRQLVRLPASAPGFEAAPIAWSHAKWTGPGAGWVDPKKEAEASGIRVTAGISTLEAEIAAQGGDWKDVQDQRARERNRAISLGLDPDPGRLEARIQTSTSTPNENEETADEQSERENRENASFAQMNLQRGKSIVPQISRNL